MMKYLKLLAFLVTFALQSVYAADKPRTVILTSDNTLVLNTEVNAETVGNVIIELKKLNKGFRFSSKKPIYLFLNTPGGSVQSGSELIEALKGSKRPVTTITLFSASMGFQMAQNLGPRLILEKGTLMSHRAKGAFQGEFGGIGVNQVGNRLKFWSQIIKEFDETTVSRTAGKQTLESYQTAYSQELWLTGKQSVEQGYADEVVRIQCDDSLEGVTTQSTSFLGFDVSYQLDKCPINTAPIAVKTSGVGMPSTSKLDEVKSKFIDSLMNKKISDIDYVF